jgi:hypothetical protein
MKDTLTAKNIRQSAKKTELSTVARQRFRASDASLRDNSVNSSGQE